MFPFQCAYVKVPTTFLIICVYCNLPQPWESDIVSTTIELSYNVLLFLSFQPTFPCRFKPRWDSRYFFQRYCLIPINPWLLFSTFVQFPLTNSSLGVLDAPLIFIKGEVPSFPEFFDWIWASRPPQDPHFRLPHPCSPILYIQATPPPNRRSHFFLLSSPSIGYFGIRQARAAARILGAMSDTTLLNGTFLLGVVQWGIPFGLNDS